MRTLLINLLAVAAIVATGATAGATVGATEAEPTTPYGPLCPITHPLLYGQDDPQVICLKRDLYHRGYLGAPDDGVAYNTHYGWQTRRAMKKFQQHLNTVVPAHKRLPVTGSVDAAWWNLAYRP